MMRIQVYDALPQSALDIRITVFVTEQGFVDEVDDIDSVATHFVLYDVDKAVATCRVFDRDKDNCVLGRFAVLREYRGKGYGRRLLDYVCDFAKDRGKHSVVLHSQYDAKDFYKKCGFSECSEVDYEQDCPHIWMKRSVDI